MPIECINCGQPTLEPKRVQLSGKVRGETYTVEMEGLACSVCGYKTIEGSEMPEFGRLLADQYRAKHGLLTSEDIRARRKCLGMSQDAFAKHLDVGIASVKRWEMGKIQDERSNQRIIERTDLPINEARAYTIFNAHCTVQCNTFITVGVVGLGQESKQLALFQELCNAVDEYQYGQLKETNAIFSILELRDHQTVPPYVAHFFSHQREPYSHARR